MNKKSVVLWGASCAALAAVVGFAPAARAYRNWKAERYQSRIAQAWDSIRKGQDYLSFNLAADDDGREEAPNRLEPERDDPRLRGLVQAAEWGYRSSDFLMQKLGVTQQEARKYASLLPHAGRVSRSAPGVAQWLNIGPTDTAKPEYNGDEYVANDTGRIASIKVDPTDHNIVYVAENGGGIWRTRNFNSATPTWAPLTDTLGEMGMGCMELAGGTGTEDRTLWAGLGDINEGTPGGVVFWSRDSGATWHGPIQLAGTYPADPQASTVATRVRDIRVDPANPAIVMAATDVGLFRSTNGDTAAPTFALMDLPNSGGTGTALLKESGWQFAWLGATGGVSSWMMSGVWAAVGAAAYASLPPAAGGGSAATPGDIWISSDAGASWSSLRAAGKISAAGLGLAQDPGRMSFGVGTPVPGDATQTTVYVQAGNANEAAANPPVHFQLATLKTVNSGATFTVVTKNTDNLASGKLTNPTLNSDCNSLDVGHNQAWYNQAIAVDPANSNNVIQGGNLCSVRSINGGTTWQAVSNWLPLPGFLPFGTNQGNTSANPPVFLPYAHADWHALTVVDGTVIVGNDGGVFSSPNAFDPTVSPTVMPVTWRSVNAGLVTHLFYTVASGDPVTGNHKYAFGGLQDNGTRMRDLTPGSTKWNQVVGGDGVSTAISIRDDGSKQVLFQSLPGRRQFCRPGESIDIPGLYDPPVSIDCNEGLLHPNTGNPANDNNLGNEFLAWNPALNLSLPNGDSEPFTQRLTLVHDGQGSLYTNTSQYAWKVRIDDSDLAHYELLSPIFQAPFFATSLGGEPSGRTGDAIRSARGMVDVTSWTYNIPGFPTPSRMYGVPLSGGFYFLGVENSFDSRFGTTIPFTWSSTKAILGTGTPQQMSSTSSIAFPHDPTHLGGAAPSIPTDLFNTFIASSVTPVDLANQLIRDDVGRIFKTTNQGLTWTSIATVASGMPNIPVYIVKFDPSDPTDNTIWAGTDIGLYRTTDGGAHWSRYGAGLPMVRVTDIFISSNADLIRIATYGRGIWEIYPHDLPPAVAGKADWDGNGGIDFLDLGALASRLGSTPADGSSRYEFTLDTDQSGSLDDSDLAALLAKYGSNP